MTNDWASSGFSGLDEVLNGLRTGDNVVWQIKRIEEYIPFIQPFCKQCLKRGVPLVYFRFARHRPLLGKADGAEIHQLNPDVGFERFVSKILDVVDEKGLDACYVFDCLSDLAVDWYSDQMLSNFFKITCPYLYKLNTIAYFGVDYSYHTKRTIDAITDTAQVIIRIYQNQKRLFIQPLKATTRYSPTMFMLHEQKEEGLHPATSSSTLSEILSSLPKPNLDSRVQQAGVWSRTFLRAQETLAAVGSGKLTYWEAQDSFSRLLRMIATRDERVIRLAETYFDLSDMVDIMQRMIGTGLIGGKALGMLLARAILRKENSKWETRLETHDSFFVGSDVFYTYLVQNDCWWLRRELKKNTNIKMELVEKARKRMLTGTFPDYVREQFMEMLDYFGQSPIIVRSSSLLEDNFGNAFSGKYESVFCPNQLAPEQRLEAFETAVRRVYASALSGDALEYRALRGLLDRDEQMALLVQRVSGDLYNDKFYPQLAGVGFSFNPYVWDKDIDPDSGFLRLVLGLGTRAVDRLEDDYTRLVALNAPEKRLESNLDEIRQYSQHHVDVLELPSNLHKAVAFEKIARDFDRYALDLCTTQDAEIIKRARQYKVKNVFAGLITFDKLLAETSFVEEMRDMLRVLNDAYEYPVDVEFTANFEEGHDYRINLLQCRPFQAKIDVAARKIEFPESVAESRLVFSSSGPIIGPSAILMVERLIFVEPDGYSKLPQQQRYGLAEMIGRLNRLHGRQEKSVILIGPGRWGTTSPSLGVPVRFSEISNISVICELGVMHEGLIPDVSLGSHFFNDLVELNMLYIAITPHNKAHHFNTELIRSMPNRLLELLPDAEKWQDLLYVCDHHSPKSLQLHADTIQQKAILHLPDQPALAN
jgi:hypothetical protein